MRCIFCNEVQAEQILQETANFKVILDIDPIQTGHLLIISKQHFMSMRELSNELLLELFELTKEIVELFEVNLSTDGVTVFQNNGEIMDEGTHFHVHIVPRYKEDEFWIHQQVIEHPLDEKRIHNLF